MINDDDFSNGRSRKVFVRAVLLVFIVIALFLADGESLLEWGAADLGIMSDRTFYSMLDDFEYGYLYDDVFETDDYKKLRDALVGKPLKQYADIEAFVTAVSQLAGDEFSYFYYDSALSGRQEFSMINDSDYEDGFEFFYKSDLPVIRFNQFAYNTGDKVIGALEEIRKDKGNIVVFDLIDNPGGMVDQCVAICDALLPETVIFEERYNDNSRYQYVSDDDMIPFEHIVILLNRDSASCSEIMALTLKEHLKDKVILVGKKTYGKQYIQSVAQDNRLNYSLYFVTAAWNVGGKTTVDLNGYLLPWISYYLSGFEDEFIEARSLLINKGVINEF